MPDRDETGRLWIPRSWPLVLIRWWLVGAGAVRADDQTPLARRFVKEAPPAWKSQQQFWLTLDSVSRYETRVRDAGGKWVVRRGTGAMKHCNGNMLDEWGETEAGVYRGSVVCENSEYHFHLLRHGDGKPWVIRDVKKRSAEADEYWAYRVEFCKELAVAQAAPPLPNVFHSRGFRCVRADPEPGGRGYVRVTFTNVPETTPVSNDRVKGGWVVLDPARYWVIVESEVELDLGEKSKVEGFDKYAVVNEYHKESSGGHPILAKSLMTGKFWKKGKLWQEAEYHSTFESRERPSIPESEFTLSAYGLPEPHGARPKKTRWYLWLGGGAIACLALAVGVRLLRRRRAAAT